jgi:hypothetical protein
MGLEGKKKLVACDLIPLNVELCGMHAFLSTISKKRYIQIIKRKRIYIQQIWLFFNCYQQIWLPLVSGRWD